MKLSARTAWPRGETPWTAAIRRARARGPLLDLRDANPTALGLVHDPEVYATLGDPAGARYRPASMGLRSAREAVAEYYARRGRRVDPARVWLCASTSEAYAQLLTLLGDPGDAVLVPRPGYPLFDILGDVAGLRPIPYPLRYDGGWYLDLPGLDAALAAEPSARAIVVVAPSNPTGHVPSDAQWSELRRRALARGIPLVVDEVFADYPLDRDGGPGPVPLPAIDDELPCLVLSGLSKVAALPQLKLSWVVMHGPPSELAELQRRAELLGDAFLSVATPVQHALPALLAAAERIQPRIRARLTANLQHLRDALRDEPLDLLRVQAGFTALLRLPELPERDDLRWAEHLLDAGVRVDPGFLFDLPAPPRIAISLLTPPSVLAEGCARIVAEVRAATDHGGR